MYVPSQPFPSCDTRAAKSEREGDPGLLPRWGTPTFCWRSSLRFTLAKLQPTSPILGHPLPLRSGHLEKVEVPGCAAALFGGMYCVCLLANKPNGNVL